MAWYRLPDDTDEETEADEVTDGDVYDLAGDQLTVR